MIKAPIVPPVSPGTFASINRKMHLLRDMDDRIRQRRNRVINCLYLVGCLTIAAALIPFAPLGMGILPVALVGMLTCRYHLRRFDKTSTRIFDFERAMQARIFRPRRCRQRSFAAIVPGNM